MQADNISDIQSDAFPGRAVCKAHDQVLVQSVRTLCEEQLSLWTSTTLGW